MILQIFLVIFANLTLAQLSCPAASYSTYVDPATQAEYRVECDYDRPHGDMPGSPVYTNSLEDCIAYCSQTPGCVDVTFVPPAPGPCYFKSVLQPPEYKPGQMAAHLLSAEGVTCPNPNPVCVDVPDYGTCYETECNMIREGTIITSLTTTTFEDCLDECEANYLNGCAYVFFQPGIQEIFPGGTCVLLSTYSQTPTYEFNVWGGIRESICWNQNGANETTWNGRTYRLECGTDLGGTNIGDPVDATGIYQCMLECDQVAGCVAVDWHWGYPNGQCYLKSSIPAGSPSSNYGVNAAIWLPN